MPRLLLFIALALSAAVLGAQDLSGNRQGTLPRAFPVSFHATSILLQISNAPAGNQRSVPSRISGDQLEQMLVAGQGEKDAPLARQIFAVELSERLNPARLARCISQLTGPQSQQALVAVADRSVFLDPPAAEIPATAKPDLATQRRMIERAVEYVTTTIHQLPNLFATRVTSTFQYDVSTHKPLHPAGKYTAVVLYRKGEERLHSRLFESAAPGLTTSGEFGPILGTAMLDAAQGHLTWSHWEQGAEGSEAVFRYAVSAEKPQDRFPTACSTFRESGSW